ncbi:FkbM family methyltransferase [Dongia rigui]|uniref:FkbM family methyltransferase n=1 Tax=Dongia rigui TaxID=940149 RepID=A0ABU5DT79_9PROT|nr:FkbM family methyltransferase [Dongia rigui]MDY0870551.1 FkbM family methyltransferase [Dongia rigui]
MFPMRADTEPKAQHMQIDPRVMDAVKKYEAGMPVIAVPYRGRKLRYALPGKTPLWRVQTLFTKEPCTIEWLESIEPGAVLLDVGANVGMYTVFAAVMRDARVFAFEPESQNYGLLCRNLVGNNISDRVSAFCCALSDEAKFSMIHLSQFTIGGSCHSFDQSVDFKLEQRESPFIQGCFSARIDQLVADGVMPVPHYVKLDVDGFEHKVIAGGMETLRKPDVRSLIIEINPHLAEHREIIDILAGLGFQCDPAQVAKAARTEGAFTGVGEYVFRR